MRCIQSKDFPHTYEGMSPHFIPLLRIKLTFLQKYPLRHSHLSKIMKETTDSKVFKKDMRQTYISSQACGKQCDVYRVGIGVIIVVSDGSQSKHKGIILL